MFERMDNLTDKQKKDIETISDLYKASNILEGDFFKKGYKDDKKRESVYYLSSDGTNLISVSTISYNGMPYFRTIENLGRAVEMVGKERLFSLFNCNRISIFLKPYIYEES